MKRFMILLLVLLTLTGCGRKEQEAQPLPQESLAPPTEPAGSYDSGNPVEEFTGGDVRAYPQTIPQIYAIACAGGDVLVFSGVENTTVTRLAGENLYRIAQRKLDCSVHPATQGTGIRSDAMVYYDYAQSAMIFLDADFLEYSRTALPEDILGEPAITEDWSTVYYFTESGLQAMDTASAMARTVRQMQSDYQVVECLLMEDSLVRCSTVDAFGNWHVLYIDTKTGELVADTEEGVSVWSGGGMYYSIRYEGEGETVVFGRPEEQPQILIAETNRVCMFPEYGTLLSETELEEGWKLDYYDLNTGLRTGSVVLPTEVIGWGFVRDPENQRVYFYGHDQSGYVNLYRWDLEKSAANDEQIYTDLWYTPENPDEEGLQAAQARAEAMSHRFGLDIRIWERAVAVQPWDYVLEPEHQVYQIQETLDQAEAVLSAFPEGFIPQILESMDGGVLRLCLVESLTGSAENGSLDSADGIQFWIDSDSYLALKTGDTFTQTLFHEIFHAMESRILSNSIVYYRWDELNPEGFDYDYDYVVNQYREGNEYTWYDDTRAFIDVYSMSFPKEDRARIFEYACMEGNEIYFTSDTMQKKLRTLCEGIRDAYDLTRSEEVFLWEQYLETPLAYGK